MFLTPGLEMGGAERWILSLTKKFQKVCTKNIFVVYGHYNKSLVEEAQKYTQVQIENFYENPNFKNEIKKCFSGLDAIISWGCPNLGEITQTFNGPIIDVSHNDPLWIDQVNLLASSSVAATHLVGVSKNASLSFPAPRNKEATVLYNGIEPERLTPKIGRKAQRTLWEISDNQKAILFLSRLDPVKNPDLAIQCLSYLPKDYILLMVANKSKIISSLGKRYLSSNSCNLCTSYSNRIKFIEPSVHVGDYFAGSDILLLPSQYEGMPLVLLEAWCASVPTVTTEYATYKELEGLHGKLGWSFPVGGSPEQCAKKIQEAYEEKTDAFLNEVKNLVLENYTVEKMVERWENYLLEVLKNWKSSRFYYKKHIKQYGML